MTDDPARHVARLIADLLVDYASTDVEIVDVDMEGMMAALYVTLADGSRVIVEVDSA